MPSGKHLPKVPLKCAMCGKDFLRIGSDTDRRYCSRFCMLRAWRRGKKQSSFWLKRNG
jgi:hypothetical protein